MNNSISFHCLSSSVSIRRFTHTHTHTHTHSHNTASSGSESDRESTSSSGLTAVMERSSVVLTSMMHAGGAGMGSSVANAGQGLPVALHHSSLPPVMPIGMTLDPSSHHHHQQLIGKQLNGSPHHLLHPIHMTSPSSLPSSSASSIASSTTSTSPGLLLSSVLPIKKVGRRGRPPKKDAKSRNRQGACEPSLSHVSPASVCLGSCRCSQR